MSVWSGTRLQRPNAPTVFPSLVAIGAAAGIGVLLASKDEETLRAGVILTGLVVTSLVLFWRVSRSDPRGPLLLRLLWASFALKLFAMGFRFWTMLLADAFAYNRAGQRIAAELLSGISPGEIGAYGTPFIRLVTGLVYYVTGVTFYGISILWAWFGLVGLLFFYLAFRTAFPRGHHRLYMLLIFLYPSMLLWTSSLGKDAPMVLFLGMAAYGAARLQHRLEGIGLWWLALGVGGAFMIRPHLTSVFVVAFAASFLIRPIRAGLMGPVLRLGGLGAAAAVAAVLVSAAGGYVGLEEVEPGAVLEYVGEAQEGVARGGSAFERVDPRTPQGFVMAIPTILFRPFPWEAHNLNALIASAEGVGLLALMLYRWRSLRAAFLAIPRNGYLLLLAVYALVFIFFFATIGNFGIIVRQRASMLYPFVLMLIAYLGSEPAGIPRVGRRAG